MSYRIGSFNIKNTRHDGPGRELFGLIADVTRDEALDIFAFQEVLNESVFASIERCLPRGWTGHLGNPGLGGHSRYRFAFFWNPNRFSECSKDHLPQNLDNYKSAVHLNREPFFGRFSPVGIGAFREYRLIDIHLTSEDKNQKKEECKTVFGPIYSEADTHRFGNNKPSVTVVLGDFNYSAPECNSIALSVAQTNGYPHIQTVLMECTHINDPKQGYNTSLDHFSFNPSKYCEQIINVSRVDAVSKYMDGKFEVYINAISDHVPIIIELE